MNWKQILKVLLYPHFIILTLLTPVSIALLIYSLGIAKTNSIVSYISYFISAYTLLALCLRLPQIIRWIKAFKKENKFVSRWLTDAHYRIKVSLYTSFFFNTAYSALHFGLGYTHKTFWFYSLAGYYITLAFIRFFLLNHTTKHKTENKIKAFKKYRICGIILLIINLYISSIVFFMVYWNRTFHHNEITTIAIATYTFSTLTMSIIGLIRYRRIGNPVYLASKSISLVASCVSILTLEATMLTTFGNESITVGLRRIMLAVSGAVVSAFIIGMALRMIIFSNKRMKDIKQEVQLH